MDSSRMPKASGKGNAMRARFLAKPSRIRRAAFSADILNGVGPGKRSLMSDFTKPGQITVTPTPWGASHPRRDSP